MATVLETFTVPKFLENPASLSLVDDKWENIPVFIPGITIPKDGGLYKVRGMVQDMHNPVIYLSKYEVVNNTTGIAEVRIGKYLDTLTCKEDETINIDSPACENDERRPYFIIPVPALSDWASQDFLEHSEKQVLSGKSTNTPEAEAKRPAEKMDVDDENQSAQKRLRPGGLSEVSLIPDKSNTNLKDEVLNGCLVMTYDVPEASIKLNDVIEAVGFLYSEPLADEDDEFDCTYKPMSPLTCRLHCVSFRKVTCFNPLVGSLEQRLSQVNVDEGQTLRKDLHLTLSQLFFGDSLVADYLICNLISQIYNRDETEMILGKFSLNICSLPENYPAHHFCDILKKILPKVQYLPFSVDFLNKNSLLPKQNIKKSRLETGLLQLSDNTHLVIDETKLEEGKLEDLGVRNVNALSSLIKRQKLDYDFTYYTVSFATDIPVIILSQNKALLPSDYMIPVIPDGNFDSSLEGSFESVDHFLSDELLKKIRIYLTVAANLPFKMPEVFNKIIQEEFVSLRQSDPSFSADNLHELLLLARFLSLSFYKTELDKTTWQLALKLVSARKSSERLQASIRN